jgi:putative FmdB family regulatory protein
MPIYEYRCEDCNKKFEKFVRYPDRETVECPGCGKANLKQLISAFRAHEPGKVKPAPRYSAEHGHPEQRVEWQKQFGDHDD